MVIEVVQGEGGLNAISNWALRELRRITADLEIPLVIDEIQSGFCRTGKMFAFNHSEVIPDVAILSKAIGGSQPLACVVYRPELDVWSPGAHSGTFRGNGLAFSTGAATLRWMREHRLWEAVKAKGELLERRLRGANSVYVGDIRGKGLMLGVELVDPFAKVGIDGLPPPDGGLAQLVQVECFRKGLLIERGGRDGAVLRPLPPLIVSEREIELASEIILEAIEHAATTRVAAST